MKMNTFKQALKRACALLFAGVLLFANSLAVTENVEATELSAGTYELSGELSAYLSAMGGVEFGGPLLTGVSLVIDADGSEYLELSFTKSSVTIYSITCDTFVDVNPSTVTTTRGVEDGVIGIYDTDGNLITEGITYTLSDDTALNSADEEVNYVDSITSPISSREETYNLALYINSNVMGVEFCNSNDSATESTYEAVLTVDWSNVEALESGTDTAEEETGAETEEETEAEAIEADEELDGLAIYEADSDDEDEDEAEAAEEEAGGEENEASGLSTGAVIGIVAGAVVVIAVVIIIIAVVGKKKKKAPVESSDESEKGSEK